MKNKLLVLLTLVICTVTVAQKKELRAVEKAIRNNDFAEAKMALKAVEPLLGVLDAEQKSEFNLLKAQALYANGTGSEAEISTAVELFAEVDSKDLAELSELKRSMINTFVENGQKAFEAKNFKSASVNFENAYRVSTKDTLYLYYAASTSVSEPDYDRAIALYEELRDINYTGITREFVATNKETNEVEVFGDKNIRDIQVKAGTHIKPETRNTESKSAEIVKNMALIYANLGQDDKALEAVKLARQDEPDDINLLLTEANIYFKSGEKAKFQELLEQATAKDPNNAELQFNLGVLAAEAGNNDAAKSYYEKAIEIDPSFNNAQLNMAVLILNSEQTLIDEMNSLGTSSADNARYDELLKEREDLYRKAIPYLEKVLENDETNESAMKTLMGIYGALGESEKEATLKAKMESN